ncbi:hypothetical protein S383_02835 [Salmonella enterica]|nr:hypothetical protein [Salmonella enterica]
MGLLKFIFNLFQSKANKTNAADPVQEPIREVTADEIKPVEDSPRKMPQARTRTKDYSQMEVSINTPIKGYLSIKDLDFFGSFSRSTSGEWLIAWQDRDVKNGVGGCRTSGKGNYVLYNDREKKIVVYGKKLERPDAGKVLNNGVFMLTDIRFGNDLKSSIYVFNTQGETLFRRTFHTNIYESNISPSGKKIFLKFLGSSEPESNKVYVIDLETKKVILKVTPLWNHHYRCYFTKGDESLNVSTPFGNFELDEQGYVKDLLAYYTGVLKRQDYPSARHIIKCYFDFAEYTEENINFVISCIDKGINKSKWPNSAADDLREKAKLLHKTGRSLEAAQCCIDAQYLDPKIKVKQLLANTCKKASITPDDIEPSQLAISIKNKERTYNNKYSSPQK